LQAPESKADFATKEEPEPQGQAATPGKLAQRNTPCRKDKNCHKDKRRVRHAQHRPPVLGQGQASKLATGCKQWPALFSRFEYHLVGQKKLNRFWFLPVNFWL